MSNLKKECECLDSIHLGPHFLYEDELSKKNNLKTIESLDECVNQVEEYCLMRSYCVHEALRLSRLISAINYQLLRNCLA
jgi:hypothetical protein